MGTVGGALWVALYVPQSIERLVARGIYVNDGFTYMNLDLPNLKWLDMSENPLITLYVGTNKCTKLEHLDLHGTGITQLNSYTNNLTYLDLSGSKFGQYFYASPFKVDMSTTGWRNLKTLNVSDCKMNRVYVKSGGASYVPDYLYVGAPNRTTGIKVELQMDSRISAKWEQTWKTNAKNKYVYAHVGNGQTWDNTNSANMKMEALSKNDETMQRSLGETLYKRLKNRYAPNDRWLHTGTVASQVKELDCSELNITDIDSIVLWMPNLEKLNCSHNLITKANFSKLLKLKELQIGRNTDLTSLTLPNSNSLVLDVLDVSYTKLGRIAVTNMMYHCKKFIASGVESLNGTLYVRNNQPLTYVDVQHTNIEVADLYCPTLETFVGDYNPQLNTVMIERGAANFKATCGGVNSDVEVRLYNMTLAKRWLDACAGNEQNKRTQPTYRVTTTDNKTIWVPFKSLQGITNLDNFIKKNINSYRIDVKNKEVTLTLSSANVTSWFANNYGEDNEHVHLEMTIYVGGKNKYGQIPIYSLEGAKNIAAMSSTLTAGSSFNITKNLIILTCNTEKEMRQWYETCSEEYPNAVVHLLLKFKDGKTAAIAVKKENYEGRIKMLNFCKRYLNSDQYGMAYSYPYLYLTDDQKEMWYGRAQSRDESNQLVYFNYSAANKSSIRIAGYAYRPKK